MCYCGTVSIKRNNSKVIVDRFTTLFKLENCLDCTCSQRSLKIKNGFVTVLQAYSMDECEDFCLKYSKMINAAIFRTHEVCYSTNHELRFLRQWCNGLVT
uniref:Apple domain-containing protein n=1 Tax=Mesocestoides corti TaxID=53468 RepID=A0A5K3FM08_MESCO